jgi:heptosyltransferase-1
LEYKNILIIKMSSVGDIIHALPFAAALRERYPQAKISWLVHPQFAGFIPEAPTINEVLYFDKEAFKKMSWGKKLSFAKDFAILSMPRNLTWWWICRASLKVVL